MLWLVVLGIVASGNYILSAGSGGSSPVVLTIGVGGSTQGTPVEDRRRGDLPSRLTSWVLDTSKTVQHGAGGMVGTRMLSSAMGDPTFESGEYPLPYAAASCQTYPYHVRTRAGVVVWGRHEVPSGCVRTETTREETLAATACAQPTRIRTRFRMKVRDAFARDFVGPCGPPLWETP